MGRQGAISANLVYNSTHKVSIMPDYFTKDEASQLLGEQLRSLRLRRNLDQRELAKQAGISLHAIKNLESGRGAKVESLIQVVIALGKMDWLRSLAPDSSFSPLDILKAKKQRQRVFRSRKKNNV